MIKISAFEFLRIISILTESGRAPALRHYAFCIVSSDARRSTRAPGQAVEAVNFLTNCFSHCLTMEFNLRAARLITRTTGKRCHSDGLVELLFFHTRKLGWEVDCYWVGLLGAAFFIGKLQMGV